MEVFKMQKDSKVIVKITDNENATVTPINFVTIVQYYSKSACFVLNLEVSTVRDDAVLTTSKVNDLEK